MRLLDRDDPGLSPVLTFDPGRGCGRPHDRHGQRPRVAILREQGVNGHVEMAASFHRAGFEAVDVHMQDMSPGGKSWKRFSGPGGLRRFLLW
jgi:phosphoribosylformylglycinamidine synthase